MRTHIYRELGAAVLFGEVDQGDEYVECVGWEVGPVRVEVDPVCVVALDCGLR